MKLSGFFQQKLFSTRLVCIVRRGHPTIKEELNLDQYLAASHVLVRPSGRKHLFDAALLERGLKRHIALEISHYMSLLPILISSDLVATVPLDLAQVCAAHSEVRILPVPVESPEIEVHQFWHSRFHKDPANSWLRGSLHALFGG